MTEDTINKVIKEKSRFDIRQDLRKDLNEYSEKALLVRQILDQKDTSDMIQEAFLISYKYQREMINLLKEIRDMMCKEPDKSWLDQKPVTSGALKSVEVGI